MSVATPGRRGSGPWTRPRSRARRARGRARRGRRCGRCPRGRPREQRARRSPRARSSPRGTRRASRRGRARRAPSGRRGSGGRDRGRCRGRRRAARDPRARGRGRRGRSAARGPGRGRRRRSRRYASAASCHRCSSERPLAAGLELGLGRRRRPAVTMRGWRLDVNRRARAGAGAGLARAGGEPRAREEREPDFDRRGVARRISGPRRAAGAASPGMRCAQSAGNDRCRTRTLTAGARHTEHPRRLTLDARGTTVAE